MYRQILTATFSLLLIATASFAQIEKATLHLDAFLCGNTCVNVINHTLSVYDEEIEDFSIDKKTRTVTVFPNPKTTLDLYEIRKELRNAQRTPWKIEIVATGVVVDYQKIYSGGEVRPRKALKIKETGQRFILLEGKGRDMLLDAVKAGQRVTIFGEIPAFNEKNLPVLVIKDFVVQNEKRADAKKDTPDAVDGAESTPSNG